MIKNLSETVLHVVIYQQLAKFYDFIRESGGTSLPLHRLAVFDCS